MKALIFMIFYMMIGLGVVTGLKIRSGAEDKDMPEFAMAILWPAIISGKAYLKWTEENCAASSGGGA